MPVNLFFSSPPNNFTKTVMVGRNVKKPIFSNNALVFYKAHSLSYGGIGTVRNHRHKMKLT
jgi:hypothetical protein